MWFPTGVRSKKTEKKKLDQFALGGSAGVAFLRNQKFRRNLLFGLTFLTVFLVFGGTVILGEQLMDHPVAFLLFWGICFSLVGVVLILAIYDIGRIRKAHRRQVSNLDKELEEIARDAERMAEDALKKEAGDD